MALKTIAINSKDKKRYKKIGQHDKLSDKAVAKKRYQKYLCNGSLSLYKCSTGAKTGLTTF